VKSIILLHNYIKDKQFILYMELFRGRRPSGHMKMAYMGKCPIKCTELFDLTIVIMKNDICNDVTSQWKSYQKNGKFCLQSLGLWSCTIIFNGRKSSYIQRIL